MKPHFETYADHISPKNAPTLIMWDRPEPGDPELDELVFPYTYCPNVAEHIDTSNWEHITKAFAKAQARTQKARRRVARLIRAKGTNACTSDAIFRVLTLCDVSPQYSDETGLEFVERLERLAEQDDYTVKSFGHWATYYDIVTFRPGSACHRVAIELAKRLDCYPILDEDDVSERESEAFYSSMLEALNRLTIVVNGVEVAGNSPESTALQVAVDRHINDNESHDYCDTSDAEDALKALGFEYDSDEFTWTGTLTIDNSGGR